MKLRTILSIFFRKIFISVDYSSVDAGLIISSCVKSRKFYLIFDKVFVSKVNVKSFFITRHMLRMEGLYSSLFLSVLFCSEKIIKENVWCIVMNKYVVKRFFHPNVRKAVLFVIFPFVLSMAIGLAIPLSIERIIYLLLTAPFGIFSMIVDFSGKVTLLTSIMMKTALLVNIFYWYVLSCIIISIIDKIRPKKWT